MRKLLKIYFDYICPYCHQGIMDLLELLPEYPEISVEWIPCESHPKPEPALIHSDLASQAMLAAADQGCDLIPFHKKIFAAHFAEHNRIDSLPILADIAAACGADRGKILAALQTGAHTQTVLDNNRLVWNTLNLEAVPCYQCGDKTLASHEDVMISKKQLRDFLNSVIR